MRELELLSMAAGAITRSMGDAAANVLIHGNRTFMTLKGSELTVQSKLMQKMYPVVYVA